MGLDDSYSQARGQILIMHTLPAVNQAYALVIQDESKKGIAGTIREGMESVALYIARRQYQTNFKPNQFQRKNSNLLYSDFCHMRGHARTDYKKLKKCNQCQATSHVREDCFLLIGYPENFKGKKKVK